VEQGPVQDSKHLDRCGALQNGFGLFLRLFGYEILQNAAILVAFMTYQEFLKRSIHHGRANGAAIE
jgi:hypothetical protein